MKCAARIHCRRALEPDQPHKKTPPQLRVGAFRAGPVHGTQFRPHRIPLSPYPPIYTAGRSAISGPDRGLAHPSLLPFVNQPTHRPLHCRAPCTIFVFACQKSSWTLKKIEKVPKGTFSRADKPDSVECSHVSGIVVANYLKRFSRSCRAALS